MEIELKFKGSNVYFYLKTKIINQNGCYSSFSSPYFPSTYKLNSENEKLHLL